MLFQTGNWLVAAGFYLFGLIMGILLISQFWTLANEIYDARQAKRLFGFIGGGASLGGIVGSSILTFATASVGTTNLLLVSAVLLIVCGGDGHHGAEPRRRPRLAAITSTGEEKGVGGAEALRMLRESKHLQVIALVIAFAAIGANLIEQQLNMAAEAFKGRAAGRRARRSSSARCSSTRRWRASSSRSCSPAASIASSASASRC